MWVKVFLASVLLGLISSCSIFETETEECSCPPPDTTRLLVTISTDQRVLYRGQNMTMTMRAENRDTTRIVWGQGSSVCQLGIQINHLDSNREIGYSRICSADIVEQGLDSGKVRIETLTWWDSTMANRIEDYWPGTVEITCRAGGWISKEPVYVTLLDSTK